MSPSAVDQFCAAPPRLEDVVSTEELKRRPFRPPQYEAENQLLVSLAQVMAESPGELYQRVAQGALELTGAESAGISILQCDGGEFKFHWRATVGVYQPFLGATLPREFSPCGTVLDRNASQLMVDPARFWPYINELQQPIAEVLLVPFYRGAVPIGTVWVVSHRGKRRFDSEDERLVTSLSRFASAAAQVQANLDVAQSANHTKDRYLAFLAHELRGPLTPALLAAASLADDQRLPNDVREDADVIRRNIELVTHLADDLLDTSRIVHGKLELRSEQVDVHVLLRSAASMCTEDAQAANLRIEFDLQASRSHVLGDAPKLTQVWCNLLKNACKFSPAESVITLRTIETAAGRLRVEIIDRGEGIEAELLGRVFNLYEQGERTVTRQHGGLGLGLAISKGIVEAHGGKISAQSEGRGHGTTLCVELPITEVLPRASRAQSRMPNDAKSIRSLSILLVDDHKDTLHLMARLLRVSAHKVTTAESVSSALAAVQQQQFDLLISDVGLGDGSGLDLMREIRRNHPLKGIALTGYGTQADIAETLSAGFLAHLTKPVDFERLQSLIAEVSS